MTPQLRTYSELEVAELMAAAKVEFIEEQRKRHFADYVERLPEILKATAKPALTNTDKP